MNAASSSNVVDPKKKIDKFDKQLLDFLEHREDDKAMSMITENMCDVVDDYGSLLHHAAKYGNERIARYLIELGANADLRVNGKTPLMIAIMKGDEGTINALLNANACIFTTDDDGVNSVDMAFDSKSPKCALPAIFRTLRSKAPAFMERVVTRLVEDGSIVTVPSLGDVELVKSMLDSGCDVNTKGPGSRTALHTAILEDDLKMVEFLIDNGADVNAIDDSGVDIILFALLNKKYNLMEVLLRRGANPNGNPDIRVLKPLFWSIIYSADEEINKCVEVLLQHGADPQCFCIDRYTIFRATDGTLNSKGINHVIARLAMLKALGTPIKRKIRSDINLNSQFKKYYALCRRILKSEICRSVTLLDLLTMTDGKIEIHMRNVEFASKLVRISHKYELAVDYPYYFNRIKKCISTITRIMRLKIVAAGTISQISDYHIFYTVAEQIADYLDERSLEQLCQLSVVTE